MEITPAPWESLLSTGVENFNALGIAGILGGFILLWVVINLLQLGQKAE